MNPALVLYGPTTAEEREMILVFLSPPWTFLVASTKQRDGLKRLLFPRKSYWNPYHPNDDKMLGLLDFSAEASDYFSAFGNLSDVETKITDKHLKINGRHYKVIKPDENPYETVDHLDVEQN